VFVWTWFTGHGADSGKAGRRCIAPGLLDDLTSTHVPAFVDQQSGVRGP
jgi:hypothetical protein